MASIIAAIVVTGTMASFVASARMTHRANVTTTTEAAAQTAQVLEELRNNVAADSTFFQDNAGGGWQALALTGTGSTHHLSVEQQRNMGAQYQVTALDCDGDGTVGDCHAVTVETAWDFD
jgi:hypothetical protein